MVHVPLAASPAFKGKSNWGLIGDAIEEIDWSVGQILQTLKELNLEQNTLVVFTSDNGAASGSAGPLRGKKGTLYEGGVREPCIMRWPGKIPAGTTCQQIAGNIDMLPTFCKLIGLKPPGDRVIDGRDITSLMFNEKAGPVRDVHLYFNGPGKLAAIRQGTWKLFLLSPPPRTKTRVRWWKTPCTTWRTTPPRRWTFPPNTRRLWPGSARRRRPVRRRSTRTNARPEGSEKTDTDRGPGRADTFQDVLTPG
jgi:arylsulfatase A-like enzyme